MVRNRLKGFYLEVNCTVLPPFAVVSAVDLIGRTLGFHQLTLYSVVISTTKKDTLCRMAFI